MTQQDDLCNYLRGKLDGVELFFYLHLRTSVLAPDVIDDTIRRCMFARRSTLLDATFPQQHPDYYDDLIALTWTCYKQFSDRSIYDTSSVENYIQSHRRHLDKSQDVMMELCDIFVAKHGN